MIQLVGHSVVAVVEELDLPLLPGEVRAELLEVVLHSAAAVLSVLEAAVQLQHTVLPGDLILLQPLGRKKMLDECQWARSRRLPNTWPWPCEAVGVPEGESLAQWGRRE